MITLAYWITAKGEILDVDGQHHIDLIYDDPERFVETLEAIHADYETFNEPPRIEGNAREVIMRRVINRGFIRIRQKRNHWFVQLHELTKQNAAYLANWAMLVAKISDQYADVEIDQLSLQTRTIYITTVFNIARGNISSLI